MGPSANLEERTYHPGKKCNGWGVGVAGCGATRQSSNFRNHELAFLCNAGWPRLRKWPLTAAKGDGVFPGRSSCGVCLRRLNN
jgi:hypothetical protein